MGFFNPRHTAIMHTAPRHLRSTAFWLALMCVLSAPVWADDRSDHNQARAAMESGQVLPLKTVLDQLERQRPGKVLEVELERKGNGWVYEIKQLEAGGQLVRIKLDARTAQIINIKHGKVAQPDDERARPSR